MLSNWCERRLLRVPWSARRSNQSILKEISPEYSLEWLRLKLKLQYFGLLMQSWLIGKDPDVGEDWRQKYKRVTVDEMAGWHHQCSGHELGQTPGDDEGQGSLACCSLWGYKESDMSWQLNNIQIIYFLTELWEFLSSKEFVHFIWVSKLIEKKLFIISSYYLTPVRTFNDTTFLIHFIANL